MWCEHKVSSLLSILNFTNEIIFENDIKNELNSISNNELKDLILKKWMNDDSISKKFKIENSIEFHPVILEVKKNINLVDSNKKRMNTFPLIQFFKFHIEKLNQEKNFQKSFELLREFTKLISKEFMENEGDYWHVYFDNEPEDNVWGHSDCCDREENENFDERYTRERCCRRIIDIWLNCFSSKEFMKNIKIEESDFNDFVFDAVKEDHEIICLKLEAIQSFIKTSNKDENYLKSIIEGSLCDENTTFEGHPMELLIRAIVLKSNFEFQKGNPSSNVI